MKNNTKINLEGNSKILNKFSLDFYNLTKVGAQKVSSHNVYLVEDDDEDPSIKREARISYFKNISQPLKKVAFDTRRVDQTITRSPRENLQNWHRSDPFISKDLDDKLKTFAKLNDSLNEIEKEYKKDPYYIGCYASELHGHVKRGLRDGINDGDYHQSHLSYLEQLIFARYRLTLDNIKDMSVDKIKEAVLSKDEKLLKLGQPAITSRQKVSDDVSPNLISTGLSLTESKSANESKNESKNEIKVESDVDSPKKTELEIIKSFIENIPTVSIGKDGRKVQRKIVITIDDEVI